MAVLTLDAPFDVPDMPEKNKFRNIDGFFPGCRCIGIIIMMFLLYPWEIGDNVLMTVKTFFNRGDSRKCRPADIRVTKFTRNSLDTRMDAVAERDRLFGADSSCR